MIVLCLMCAGLWTLVGFSFGFDSLIWIFAGALVALCLIAFLDARWHRRHMYDDIDVQGRTRIGMKEAAAPRKRPAA